MSPPAFLDSSTGQFSSFESLSRFGSCYNNMNSSSSNSNHGFSNLNEANPILGFNSPPLAASGSGSNLSRPRLVKMRRQASSLKHRSSSPDLGPGFNHFGSSSESVLGNLSSGNVEKEPFWLGANRGMNLSSYSDSERRVSSGSSNVILDGMRKLKIGLDKDYDLDHANAIENHDAFKLKAFESENKKSFADELPKEISKLKIEDMSNLGNRKNFQCIDPVNKTQFTNFVNDNVGVELQNEMKKMNLNHPGDVYIGSKNFKSSEKKVDFGFTSKLDDMGVPPVEFKVPDMKSNLFSGVDVFEAKRESVKDTRLKKKKGKLRKPIVGQSRIREDLGFSGRISLENQETFEAYSPMDISPYHETLADNYSRGTSVTSEEGYQTDQDLLDAVQCLDINVNHGDGESCLARDEVFEPQMNEVSETESFKSATENLEFVSDNTFVTALDSEVSSTATSGFKFASKLENSNTCKDGFTFAAFSSSQSQLPPDTRQHKKKHRLKTVHDSYSAKPDSKNLYISSPSAEFFPISGNSSILSPGKGQKVDISPLLSKQKDNSISKPVNEQGVKHGTVVTSSGSNLAQEACEKWRLRGNQAYGNGDLAKAEDYYTQGLNSISESEISRSYLRAMMLCYSNRAATRISLGRMREALEDCLMAAKIDPNFLKVRVRAAHCYLAIGEVENATREFMKCLQSESDVIMDRKLMAEVSEGLEKAKKVSNCITQYTDLTQRRTSEDLERALRFIDEALLISTFSEKLLQMKADALLMLRKYEQVIQVCEWTLSLDTPTSSSSRLWISSLIVKSYFYLGKLDEALEFIKKQENSQITEGVGNTSQESVIPLADTVRELLSHKAAGNEAYKSGKHAEAVEHYTAVLSCNVESWPFSAICFCNRAAAYRALGQITDAIADCSLAIALDPNYLKAISRRAGLYEMIRDYGQAAIDIQRVVSLLTKQVEEKVSDKISCMNELKQTQLQLSNMEEESRKGIPLNMYLILGIESSASGPDIKKAYRRAALKHHPDKAGQSLSRSDNGDDGLWKEIAENVHKDADRLFKMIGEAYALLSNPSKRSRYDVDEEMRKEANNRFSRRNSSDGQNTRQDYSWRPYGNTQSKASEKTASSYKYSRYP